MSLVPYLKFMLLNTTAAQPTYTAPNLKAVPPTPGHCGGVEMDLATHHVMVALLNDFKTRRNDLFKEFPDQFLIAQCELIDELRNTGNQPTIDLNARQLRRAGVDFAGLLDELDNEDEEEFLDEDEDDEEVEEEPVKKAVTKPLKKAKKAPVKKEDKPAEEKGKEPKKVPARRGRKKVEEAPKEDASTPVDPATETAE